MRTWVLLFSVIGFIGITTPGCSSGAPTSTSSATPASPSGSNADKEWAMPNKNMASTRYSTLDDINAGNVKNLKVAWTFSTGVLRGARRRAARGRQHDVYQHALPEYRLCA